MKLKIPPVAIFALFALLMWALARHISLIHCRSLYVAGACVIVGACIALVGVIAFRKARTTVNPYKLESSRELVTTGIYTLSRNPMYLGMAIMLVGWAFWLGEMLALLGVVGFMMYITYSQILPEEQVLKAKFGKSFEDYCQRTRRWL
ncbi:MAG: isoprenylcysteine carboxylmethyltransferase family protein [Porphyromonadaceae bacterium]|nr:isoprenylcysteine carboxylmethyltransferase family protein [Porphyromonadaceae bacterium]